MVEHRYRLALALALFLLVLLVTLSTGLADPPEAVCYWAASYGASEWDEAWSVEYTADGGVVAAGWTESYTETEAASTRDMVTESAEEEYRAGWIVKLDARGEVEWENSYWNDWELFDQIIHTSDLGYATAGTTYSPTQDSDDFWVVKLDASGEIEWQKAYGGEDDEEATCVRETTDGGYVVIGDTKSFGAGNWDVWVLKLDSTGTIEWEKTYGGNHLDRTSAEPIVQTADGGYIFAGRTESWGDGRADLWVVKLEQDGDIDWQRTYGDWGDDMARSIKQAPDGGYIVVGYTYSFGDYSWNVWLLKLDKDGEPEWQKTYGGPNGDFAYSVQNTLDGGYVFAGETDSFGGGGWDGWIVKVDQDGNVLWQRAYGASEGEWLSAVRQTPDGGFVAAGTTDSFDTESYDFWVLKLNRAGAILDCSVGTDSSATVEETDATCDESEAEPADSQATVVNTSVTPVPSDAAVDVQCFMEAHWVHAPVILKP